MGKDQPMNPADFLGLLQSIFQLFGFSAAAARRSPQLSDSTFFQFAIFC